MRRQARYEKAIMKMNTRKCGLKSVSSNVKRKRKFLPTNRNPIEFILQNIEVLFVSHTFSLLYFRKIYPFLQFLETFLPEAYRIQRCYRAKSVFKSNHIIELKRNFDLLDVDNSGTLTVTEFCSGFEAIRDTVKRIFARAKGNEEALDFVQFLKVLYPDTYPEEIEMMKALVLPPPEPTNMTILDLAALFRRVESLKEDKGKHRGKIQLSEIISVMARCDELYNLVIKWSRFERSRWDYLVTFEDLLSRLFPSFTQKEIRKMAVWAHSPPVPKLSEENEIEIQTQFMRWDANGSGDITFDELNTFLKENDIDISKGMVQSIFRHMDKNCDKLIQFGEFKSFFEYAWMVCESEVDSYFEQIYQAKRAAEQPFSIEMI